MKKAIVVIAFTLVAIFGFVKINEAQEAFQCKDATIVVKPGDTLWGIARENCTGNVQVAVDELVRKYGDLIDIGLRIELP